MRILVVEDDALLGDAIQAGLRQQGFVADWVRDGVAADLALEPGAHDAVVLDVGLPRRSGLEVLARLRGRKDKVPVLILTARDTVEDRIAGLDAGADDYLVKPFDMGELAARLRALTRRAGGSPSATLVVGALCLDPASREVTWRGEPRPLSRKEFALLHAFMLGAGKVLTRRLARGPALRLGRGDRVERPRGAPPPPPQEAPPRHRADDPRRGLPDAEGPRVSAFPGKRPREAHRDPPRGPRGRVDRGGGGDRDRGDHEVGEVFDAHLVQSASLLAMRVGEEVDEIDTEHAPVLHKYAKPLSFQVWKRGRRLLLHSADAPDKPLSAQDRGFSTVTAGGREWRVFSLWDAKGEQPG